MDIDDMKMMLSMFNEINARLRMIQLTPDNKLRIAMVLDVTDDKVHMTKQIVHMYDTPDGVVVKIK